VFFAVRLHRLTPFPDGHEDRFTGRRDWETHFAARRTKDGDGVSNGLASLSIRSCGGWASTSADREPVAEAACW
jgi:hypothetical protein